MWARGITLEAQRPRGSVGQKRGVVGRRRAAEGGGVASPRPQVSMCSQPPTASRQYLMRSAR